MFALQWSFCNTCVFSSGACLAFSYLFPLDASTSPSSTLVSFIPQQGDVSNEGRIWPKEHDDHHQLYTSSLLLSIALAAFSPSCAILYKALLSSHLSSFSLLLSVCHSLSHLLIPNSTFHQLLVSPNSCHVDVDGLGNLLSHTLQMCLIKVGGGLGGG